MEKVFEHYHLSLIERDQPDLLITHVSREAFLRKTFSEKFTFHHHGKTFYWVPHSGGEPMVLGTVERKRQRAQHTSPDDGGVEFIGEEWQGSLVIIDPAHRPDGQKLAFEKDQAVGQTNAILDSMVAYLNGRTAQYAIHVKPLFHGETFWRFAHRHGNVVKYVSFDFVVPNMFFGTSTGVDQGLKRIGKDTGAQSVKITLESEDGVRTDSDNVKSAIEYAEEGNATVTAKALNGERYSSTKKRKSVRVNLLVDFNDAKERLGDWIGRVLGREQGDSLVPPDSNGHHSGSD